MCRIGNIIWLHPTINSIRIVRTVFERWRHISSIRIFRLCRSTRRANICLLIPTRIIINHRAIRTVGIQIQPVTTIGIFLQESAHHRIIIPRSKIVLPRLLIILLSRIQDAVADIFTLLKQIAKCIILI